MHDDASTRNALRDSIRQRLEIIGEHGVGLEMTPGDTLALRTARVRFGNADGLALEDLRELNREVGRLLGRLTHHRVGAADIAAVAS